MATNSRVFGHVPGVDVGAIYDSFSELNAVGLHKPSQGGISSSESEGADSVVISGGYEDDLDFGDEIVYTGQGGRNASGKHVKDQELIRGNLALVKNEIEGLPVRVIRGAHPRNDFAPFHGYRYDGLYRVDSHWSEIGKSKFRVWRYRLLRIENGTDIPNKSKTAVPLPTGTNLSPIRKKFQVQRIVRDTQQAKGIKKHYDYACQVCGIKIATPAGFYAEAAHIRPLGAPHDGPDTSSNILCLCPNHHVMFDLGVLSIADDLSLIGIEGKLSLSSGHQITLDHLRYHREHHLLKSADSK